MQEVPARVPHPTNLFGEDIWGFLENTASTVGDVVTNTLPAIGAVGGVVLAPLTGGVVNPATGAATGGILESVLHAVGIGNVSAPVAAVAATTVPAAAPTGFAGWLASLPPWALPAAIGAGVILILK